MSEWKPGDLAMVTVLGGMGRARRAVWTGHLSRGPGWVVPYVGYWDFFSENQVCARRLVVIDPEDLDAVADLWKRFSTGVLHDQDGITAMQAALREFAQPQPPKPEEPTGLGAVVEDADGNRWVRLCDSWRLDQKPGGYRSYAAIDAVRVLSEGVTDV